MISGQLEIPYNQFSEHDEKILSELVSRIDLKGTICEIGCWVGHSTSILAKNRKTIVVDNFKGNDGTPLFDFAKENKVEDIFINNMKELGVFENIKLLKMDSNEAHIAIDNNSIDLLFIDAGHTYVQVKNDLLNYMPKVKKGGIICGHDYESDTYDEAHINEDYVNGKHHGVIKAVNEILGNVFHEGRMWWINK